LKILKVSLLLADIKAGGKNLITTYQIRSVLRVYGDQLKRRNMDVRENFEPSMPAVDFVDISIDARRKQTLTKMSSNLISKITPKGDQNQADEHQSVSDLH
jgi:hypothetical protein